MSPKRDIQVLTPDTYEKALSGNGVFAVVIKLKWGQWMKVGPFANPGVIRQGNMDRDTHREYSHMKMVANDGTM